MNQEWFWYAMMIEVGMFVAIVVMEYRHLKVCLDHKLVL